MERSDSHPRCGELWLSLARRPHRRPPADADGSHRFRNGPFGRDVVQAPGGASGLSHDETRCAAFAGAGASSASATCQFRESIPHPVQPLSTLRTPRRRDARKTRSLPACSALNGPDFHWQAHSSFPLAPRTGLLPEVGRDQARRGRVRSADPQTGGGHGALGPVLRPERRLPSVIPPIEPPSLHVLRRRSSRPCSGASPVLRGSSDPSPVPRQLRLLAFLPRPGIAAATAGQTRSPRFRRDPFVRDGVFDHGRATAPCLTGPHISPSTFPTGSASANSILSRLNSPPHTIAVYASRPPSPTTPQHSLPGARYGLPGPDLHRLDRASLPGAREIIRRPQGSGEWRNQVGLSRQIDRHEARHGE